MPALIALVTYVVFLILKLTGTVDWSWGHVNTPGVAFVGAVYGYGKCRDDHDI